MKLTRAELRRYRSIEESGPLDVEADVTCLVGKNESGKTTVLQALFKSSAVDGTVFDEGIDYPARFTRERRGKEAIPVSVLTYELDEEDVTSTEELFGPGVLPERQIVITTGYRFKGQTWKIDVDESAAVEFLRAKVLDSLPPGNQRKAEAAATVRELITAVSGTSVGYGVSDTVARWRDSRVTLAILDHLAARRPKFVYFGDYDSMPGKVSIPDLIEKRDTNQLSRGEQAVLALLTMADLRPEDSLEPNSHEQLVRDLENVGSSITSEVFEYWTQNKDLSVRVLYMEKPEAAAPAHLSRPPLLQIRVHNNRQNVSVSFDERSRGFVWFFSFLAYFSQLEDTAEQPLILLLDEPGLNLHATAQADLLRFIGERLATKHQVIFSTHSPFMIDAHRFQRVRTVVDDDKRGTVVSADVLHADAETAFPLHAALGVELSQTLFVGPNVLLVEGPGDLLYLEVLSQALKGAGRPGLDQRWVITPGGGIAKLPAFVTLLGANKLNTVVLTDSSTKDVAVVERLRRAGRLGAGGLVQVGEVLGRREADIEDLFEPAFYVELVNSAYADVLGDNKLTVDELPPDDRLVRRVERAMEARGVSKGRINHFAPASALVRANEALAARISGETLDRAERLCAAVNAYLRE